MFGVWKSKRLRENCILICKQLSRWPKLPPMRRRWRENFQTLLREEWRRGHLRLQSSQDHARKRLFFRQQPKRLAVRLKQEPSPLHPFGGRHGSILDYPSPLVSQLSKLN
ncbi:hypothetical protein HY26_08365 [Hyphomonas sp. GM-8P]|nr:hypothetical protein HY26_08365 [Hyphomonas sp. GM-8P]